MVLGFGAGLFPRRWLFVPVAAVGWPLFLVTTDVGSGIGWIVGGAVLGAGIAAIGVFVGWGVRRFVSRNRS